MKQLSVHWLRVHATDVGMPSLCIVKAYPHCCPTAYAITMKLKVDDIYHYVPTIRRDVAMEVGLRVPFGLVLFLGQSLILFMTIDIDLTL